MCSEELVLVKSPWSQSGGKEYVVGRIGFKLRVEERQLWIVRVVNRWLERERERERNLLTISK